MTGQLTNNVRLVRCPRCRGLLREYPNIPVYRCGGCSTVLQAKKRKHDTKDVGSYIQETDTAQKSELEHVSDDKEAQSLSQEETLLSTSGLPLDKNYGSGQNEIKHGNREQSGEMKVSSELSAELTCHGNEESSPAVRAETDIDKDESPLEQKNGRDQNGHGYESEESSLLAGVHSEVDEIMNCLEQNNGRNQSEFEDYKREWPDNIKFSNEVPSSTELTCQEIEESSPAVGTSTELDENFKSRFIFGSSTVENLPAVSPRDSIITAQRPLGERISTDNHKSPCSEQLEQSWKRAANGFDRVSSVDTLENIALVNPSSESSVMLRDMPKSPTTRNYYADAGSVSSYDGTDDQVPDLHLHLSRRKFKEAVSVSTKAMPRRDEVMNKITSGYQHQAWNCSSIASEGKHFSVEGNKWCQDELLESTRHGHPVRSRMKLETDECLPRVPFYSRGCNTGYENGSPSNYGRNEFQCGTSFHSPNKPEYPEEETMELLKMVYKLQDQLNRAQISKGKANGRFTGVAGTEKQIPSYHRGAPEVEICDDFSSTRYPGRCNQRRSLTQQSRISQIPFSAEATISRPRVDHSCLHCCPQDRKYSAPLPPHICCNRSQYTAHPSQRRYDLYCSSPSTPLHYKGSEFSLQSCDAKTDDHSHTNHDEVTKYSRERHPLVKRHIRPVAGGAPFLVCSGCSELLRLPADFLLFRRRCHRLRCSACSVILKFSLQNRTHIVPYTHLTPDTIAPPPSEVDDCSDANNGRKVASVSYANNCSRADQVSCSDDCGPSLCKSFSTEEEPFSVTLPLHTLKRDSNDRNMSSGSSFEPLEERKNQSIFKESDNKYMDPVKTFASSGPSSKMYKAENFSSEIQELPPMAGSPLHRLMGYSSPSEVVDS